MAKIRIARKSDVYAAVSVLTAIFMAIGIFFVGYTLKKHYGEDVGKQSVTRTVTPAPAPPTPDAGGAAPEAGTPPEASKDPVNDAAPDVK